MKKLGVALIALVAVLGAAWSGGWFYFKGQVEAVLDAQEARVTAQGGAVKYASRSVSGFPLGFNVEYLDAVTTFDGGAGMLSAPWIRGRSDAFSPGNVTLTFPPEMEVTLTPPGAPAPIKLKLASKDLTLVTTVEGDGATQNRFSAATLDVSQIGEAPLKNLLVQAEALAGSARITGDRQSMTAEATAAQLNVAYAYADVLGDTVSRTGMTGFKASYEGNLLGDDDLAALTAGTKSGKLTYSTGETSFDGTVGSADAPVKLTGSAATSTGEIGIAAGIVTLGGTAGATVYSMDLAGLGVPVGKLDVKLSGLDARFVVPVSKRDAAETFTYRVGLKDLTVNEEVWAIFDPAKLLPRDPAQLEIDLAGKGRWLVDPATFANAPAEPGSNPLVFEDVTVQAMKLSLAGAAVEAAGAATIDNSLGAPMPNGKIEVKASGINALLQKIGQIGLIQPEQVAMMQGALGAYATPGASPDSLVSTIEMSPSGLTVNGLPLQ